MKRTTPRQSKRSSAVPQREWSDTSVALPPPENLLLERLATTLSGGIIIDALERALLEYLHRAAGAGSTRGLSTKLDLAVRRRSARSSAFNLKTLPIELPMPHDDSTLGEDLLHLQTYLWVLVYAFESKEVRPGMPGQYFLSDQTYLALMRALLRFPEVDDTPPDQANDERPLRSELPKKAIIEKERRLLRVRLGKNVLKAAQQRMTKDRIRGFSELDQVAPTMLVTSSSAQPVSRGYGYDATRDVLTSWTDGTSTSIVTLQPDGRRQQETRAGVTLTYAWNGTAGERLVGKTGTGGGSNIMVPTYNTKGEMSTIDIGGEGTIDLTFLYGFLGQPTSVNKAGTGLIAFKYDAAMRRTRKSGPTTYDSTTWRYGSGGAALQEHNEWFGNALINNTKDTDTIYLMGEPIAYVVSQYVGGVASGPTLLHAHADRMGIARKVTTTAGVSVNRLVMDATGHGTVVSDTSSVINPPLGVRYPGQYEDSETGVIQNRWRVLVPGLGLYSSPDAMPPADTGPQGYLYAAGRPLLDVDPDGRQVAVIPCTLNVTYVPMEVIKQLSPTSGGALTRFGPMETDLRCDGCELKASILDVSHCKTYMIDGIERRARSIYIDLGWHESRHIDDMNRTARSIASFMDRFTGPCSSPQECRRKRMWLVSEMISMQEEGYADTKDVSWGEP